MNNVSCGEGNFPNGNSYPDAVVGTVAIGPGIAFAVVCVLFVLIDILKSLRNPGFRTLSS